MILRIWIGIWLFLGAAAAESLQTGIVYRGPVKLTAENLGASFMLPEGWKGELVHAKGPMVLQDTESTSRILLEANVSVIGNPIAMLGQKRVYYDMSLFSPTQVKRMSSSLYYRHYRVKGSDTFKEALIYLVLGSQDRAVLLYGFFEEGMLDRMRHTMISLSERLSFTVLRALPKQMTDLYLRLENAHLVFYERIGSYSEKREVWLCRNKEALLKGTYASDNRMARYVRSYRGQWRLDAQTLSIEVSPELVFRYEVTLQGANLLIDGEQTFRLPNSLCE